MRTFIQRIVFLVLPLTLTFVMVSACGSHRHRTPYDRDARHDGTYDRESSEDRHDRRDRDKHGDHDHRGDRDGGNDWRPWLRW
ncbi:MAG: hypothetical protein HOP18_19845 [Deltaproteobacteria bacterium]|nr:hypothetical protein [Deltaproteobacteria bacterium]